ncbi:MAG: amidohydrolase family protein [Bacillota bacterium]|nr:amidohydrolase family protein [Bacillota bacterium]
MRTVIKVDRVIDGSGRDAFGPAAVVVEDNLITLVREGPMGLEQDTRIVDLPGCTLMPGLMDAHIHVTGITSRGPVPPAPDLAYRTLASVQSALRHGVTTIRDVGSYLGVPVALRRAIARKQVIGPRILACGKLIAMSGGHAYQLGMQADGVDEVVKAVREQFRDGADFIKTVTTHRAALPEFTQPELDALVAEAHRLGRKVACHAGIEPGIGMAVRAGVDSIEHCWIPSDETLAAIKARGTAIVPTLAITGFGYSYPERPQASAERTAAMLYENVDQAEAIKSYFEGTFQRLPYVMRFAKENGLLVGAGTDAPITELPYHSVIYEVELLAKFGFDAMEAICAATSNNARILGLDRVVGKIEPGLAADVIAVRGDPLQDVRALRDVCFVMRDGQVIPDPEPTQALRQV